LGDAQKDDIAGVTMGDAGRPSKGLAFVKGGFGCLVAFFVIGGFVVLIGGTMWFDAGGLVLLFVIGGIIGLIVSWIYQRGRRSAQGDE
jgi:hypothetical protein